MNKNIDIKNLKVAKRYAHALVESANSEIQNVNRELALVSEAIFDNEDLKLFFSHPIVSLKDKKDTIKDTLEDKIGQTTYNFLNTLLDENRIEIFKTIYELFKKELDEINNKQQVEVISAVELDEEEKNKLIEKLSQKLNKEVNLTLVNDDNILGGLVVKFEDKVIDLSLKTKFDTLRKYI